MEEERGRLACGEEMVEGKEEEKIGGCSIIFERKSRNFFTRRFLSDTMSIFKVFPFVLKQTETTFRKRNADADTGRERCSFVFVFFRCAAFVLLFHLLLNPAAVFFPQDPRGEWFVNLAVPGWWLSQRESRC